MKNKKVEEQILNTLIKIAKRGEGALVVVGEPKFKSMVKQQVKRFNIIDNPKLFESLALMDGAIILDDEGNLKYYGVKLESEKVFKNFGTRHAGALSSSGANGNISFCLSEEDNQIRIFKKGKILMQIPALKKGIEKEVSNITNILESLGVGAVGMIGVNFLLTTGLTGIVMGSGIIIFGSAVYLYNKLKGEIK